MHADSMLHSSFADAPPAWVTDSLGRHDVTRASSAGGRGALRIARGREFVLLTAAIPSAADLSEDALRNGVCEAYDAILSTLEVEGLHAVRFWNYIPALHTLMAPGIDRYMVFNSGRFLAYSRHATDTHAFARTLPTSSGVGSSSPALTIHCFAGPMAGRPIEHARQIPAYQYSFRYGPHPPCFARATLVDMPSAPYPRLLVGGTASVRGEDSVHLDRLDAQLDETLENLASIVSTARAGAHPVGGPPSSSGVFSLELLALFTELRVYLPRLENRAVALARLAPSFPRVSQIEVVQADLCRRELLIEIEGVATLEA